MALGQQTHRSSTPVVRRPPAVASASRPRPIPELFLIAVIYAVYRLGRMAAEGRVSEAFGNAAALWHVERDLHLPSETAVQHLMMHSPALVFVANTFYATVHFPATVLFLAWMYVRRPAQYLRARRVLALLTVAALVLHVIMPLAPPRMLHSTGLVDTGRQYGPSVYGNPHTDTFSNQFAAMPSLHVGWALYVAVELIATTRGRLRWLWLLHPTITLLVVVGTANHYWTDCIAAALLLALAYAVIPQPRTSADSAWRQAARQAGAFASRARGLRPERMPELCAQPEVVAEVVDQGAPRRRVDVLGAGNDDVRVRVHLEDLDLDDEEVLRNSGLHTYGTGLQLERAFGDPGRTDQIGRLRT